MTDHVSEVIELDGTRFRHRMISAAGTRFHLVEGGVGSHARPLGGWRKERPP
jgi:hypothetical protein